MTRGIGGTDGGQGLGGHDPRELLRGALEGEAEDPAEEARLRAELGRLLPDLELLERLGRGGMGIVWRARQRSLGRTVALKVLAPRGETPPDLAERFEREARALARLVHPGIVAVHAYGREGELCWLVMECVEGQTLRELLAAGPLEPARALALAGELCAALQYAHARGVVHRDVKPENVLLDAAGHAKIADFGLAKLLGEPAALVSLTASQQVLGTLRYMAPEQLDRPLEVDHRADLYALGVVLYEMLTGEVPMGRFDLPSVRLRTPARLDRVIERSLQREPARRYQQASEVGSDVADASAHLGRTVHGAWAPRAGAAVVYARVTRIATLFVPVLLWSHLLLGAGFLALQRRVIAAERDSEALSTPLRWLWQIASPAQEVSVLAALPLYSAAVLASVVACSLGWVGIARRSRDPALDEHLRTLTLAASQLPWTLVCVVPGVAIMAATGARAGWLWFLFAVLATWTVVWGSWAEAHRRWLLRPARGFERDGPAARTDPDRGAAAAATPDLLASRARSRARWTRACLLLLPAMLWLVGLDLAANQFVQTQLPLLEENAEPLSGPATWVLHTWRSVMLIGLPLLGLAFAGTLAACLLGWFAIAGRARNPALDAHLHTFCLGAWQLPWSAVSLPVLLLATRVLSSDDGAGFTLLFVDLSVWTAGWLAIARGHRRWLRSR